MDFNYSNRGYLLPEGCKDLIEVIQSPGWPKAGGILLSKFAEYKDSLVATIKLPEKIIGDIAIMVDGQQVRIVPRSSTSQALFERVIEVPAGYNPAAAKAVYLNGILRILIPKC
jgi:HSP20 family molecular chaperone IbpA